MKIYTIKFRRNGKKYGYRTTNYKMIKKIKRKVKNYELGYYDPDYL